MTGVMIRTLSELPLMNRIPPMAIEILIGRMGVASDSRLAEGTVQNVDERHPNLKSRILRFPNHFSFKNKSWSTIDK